METHAPDTTGSPQVPPPDSDDERRDGENQADALPDHLDLPLETPEADALEQERPASADDEAAPR